MREIYIQVCVGVTNLRERVISLIALVQNGVSGGLTYERVVPSCCCCCWRLLLSVGGGWKIRGGGSISWPGLYYRHSRQGMYVYGGIGVGGRAMFFFIFIFYPWMGGGGRVGGGIPLTSCLWWWRVLGGGRHEISGGAGKSSGNLDVEPKPSAPPRRQSRRRATTLPSREPLSLSLNPPTQKIWNRTTRLSKSVGGSRG